MMTKTPGNYQHLLVCVDAFVGWLEAFPYRSEKTSEVIKAFLKGMVPMFGLPSSIQSDSGRDSVAKVTRKFSQQLKTQWKFLEATICCKNKTEKMNHTLRKTTAKCCQETNLK